MGLTSTQRSQVIYISSDIFKRLILFVSLPLAPCLRPATKPFSSLFILGKGKGLWGWLCWCGRLCYCLCSQPSTAQSNEHAEYPRSSLFKNIYLRRGTPFHSEQHLWTGFALAAKEAWNSRKLLKTNLLLKFRNRNTPISPSLGNKTPLNRSTDFYL